MCLTANDPTITLSVITGEFYSCTASTRGGGIFVQGTGEVTVKETLFYKGIAQTNSGSGGGGIDLWSLKKPPHLEGSSFIQCKTADDGGGVGIWSSPSFQQTCFVSCHFAYCEINHTTGSDGGCIIVWLSNAAIACSNTLFVDSHSEFQGGAMSHNIYSNLGHNSSIPLFFFCFFKNNSAKTNPGHDVYFEDWRPTQPFVHCFSLSATNRVYDNKYKTAHNNDWLPQEIAIVVHILQFSQIYIIVNYTFH